MVNPNVNIINPKDIGYSDNPNRTIPIAARANPGAAAAKRY